ncbi:hypothetical protein GGS23DRAFT_593418 [Durotheca rogersii]|uniref:uncharacterized protein n=1 Tax=Durotheca rogersii TaxID=419775 RepID=UPI00221F0AF5|nr:uncharacterized protein GGS23DRAFT_593418 [Durotheca rogersii]KAI5866683.1 hypothetical protein GGS23DRAFT_593418 [Durotheca rogersii]
MPVLGPRLKKRTRTRAAGRARWRAAQANTAVPPAPLTQGVGHREQQEQQHTHRTAQEYEVPERVPSPFFQAGVVILVTLCAMLYFAVWLIITALRYYYFSA